MPRKNEILLEKNRRYLDGYDVKIWTEKDLDLTPAFVQRAYTEKRWAFVSDYLRFVILRDFGGIYLDTDMELLRPLDDLLNVPAFTGLSHRGDLVYCGAIGTIAHTELMQKIVEAYDAIPAGTWPTSPEVMTSCMQANPDLEITVHPYYTFYPVDEGRKPDPAIMSMAHATHHWDESWRSHVWLRRILRRVGIIPLYHYFFKPPVKKALRTLSK